MVVAAILDLCSNETSEQEIYKMYVDLCINETSK